MGRPPCCDIIGVKKGQWIPEEDIILVTYIQQHGPGNWRAIPTNTGLLRCSKSCRLRWTNYLRPGIKRGNFSDHEEKIIIHLQALLGNRWAAIASYLPQRTDNDIKNYWNTHLNKKLKRIRSGLEIAGEGEEEGFGASSNSVSISNKGQWERRLQTDMQMAKQALSEALSLDSKTIRPNSVMEDSKTQLSSDSANTHCNRKIMNRPYQTSTYASSADNIARLLQGWMKNPRPNGSKSFISPSLSSSITTKSKNITAENYDRSFTDNQWVPSVSSSSEGGFDSIFSFNQSSNSDISTHSSSSPEGRSGPGGRHLFQDDEREPDLEMVMDHRQMPLSLLEKWLLDDNCTSLNQHDEDHHHSINHMHIGQDGFGLF